MADKNTILEALKNTEEKYNGTLKKLSSGENKEDEDKESVQSSAESQKK